MLYRYLNAFITLCALSCFLMSLSAQADTPTLTITGSDTALEEFNMEYWVDDSGEASLNEVREQSFKPSKNFITLGYDKNTVWTRVKLENTSSSPIELYIHYSDAYRAHQIELYQTSNGNLLQAYELDLDQKATHEFLYGGTAVFNVKLDAQSSATLYTKHVVYTSQWFSTKIYSLAESKRALLNQYFEIVLIITVLLTLSTYNLMLFFSSRSLEHFYYASYLIVNSIWISFSYGLLANVFHIYGEKALLFHTSLAFMPIFLLLFMIQIFDLRKKYPIEFFTLIIF